MRIRFKKEKQYLITTKVLKLKTKNGYIESDDYCKYCEKIIRYNTNCVVSTTKEVYLQLMEKALTTEVTKYVTSKQIHENFKKKAYRKRIDTYCDNACARKNRRILR